MVQNEWKYSLFKVVSPSPGMGKSSFRKPWPVGFVCTIPLLFCVYICTSIDFNEFLAVLGSVFVRKQPIWSLKIRIFTTENGEIQVLDPFWPTFWERLHLQMGGRRVHPWFRVGFCWFSNFPARVESVLKKSGAKILNINKVTTDRKKTRDFFVFYHPWARQL